MRLWFGRKRKRAPRSGPPARDPLLAVPVVMPEVEVRFGQDGLAQMRREEARSPGWSAKMVRLLRLPARHKVVQLDEVGSAYIRQVDGARMLGEVARRIAKEFSMEAKEANQSAVEYTQMLMLRGMVGVKLEDAEKREPSGSGPGGD